MKLTKTQMELLTMLASGPRCGFTNLATINSLVERGLARKVRAKNTYGQKSFDWVITAAGKKLVPPRPTRTVLEFEGERFELKPI